MLKNLKKLGAITLEWVVILGVIVIAAIAIVTAMMLNAKDNASAVMTNIDDAVTNSTDDFDPTSSSTGA